MPARKTAQTEKPTFVFKGTIKKLKSATMKTVAVDSKTIVVTVDQLIEAPPDLAAYAGQEITVQLSGAVKPKVGQQLIFHTVSGQYGESVEVRSLSEEPVQASHAAVLSAAGDPVERRREKDRRRQFDDADLVVSGKVLAVTLPPSEQAATKGASKSALAAAAPRRKPISEHDPKWRDAVVEVDDVHKGKHKKKKIIVRFPASTDVMWYNAPKFHPGQEGHFLLQKTKTKKPAKGKKAAKKGAAAAAPAETMDTYVALDPLDFQPYSEPGGIKKIIDSENK